MCKIHYIVLLVGLLLLQTVVKADAQTFNGERLRKAAETLGITSALVHLPQDSTSLCSVKGGKTVCVRTDTKGSIDHIGIPLFDMRMRALSPSPVYDFLEYAVLSWKYKLVPNTLHLSKVLFEKGNWETLASERLNLCDCIVNNHDHKMYVVTWSKNGKEVAVVGVPVEYELLGNDTRRNMEKELIRRLEKHTPPKASRKAEQVKEGDLKVYGTEGLFVVEGKSLLVPELNQNCYYQFRDAGCEADATAQDEAGKDTAEDVTPVIVSDATHPMETFANLMLSRDPATPDTQMALDFHLSDYKRHKATMPLSTLRDFFQQEGCSIFYAASGIKDGMANAMLLVHNAAKGYNHLFSLRMPAELLTAEQPRADAAVYLYIPSIEKTGLFAKPATKKSGAKFKQHL